MKSKKLSYKANVDKLYKFNYITWKKVEINKVLRKRLVGKRFVSLNFFPI
jgi:hypothetical protein